MAPAVSIMATTASLGAAALCASQAFVTPSAPLQAQPRLSSGSRFLGQGASSAGTESSRLPGAAALVTAALGISALAAGRLGEGAVRARRAATVVRAEATAEAAQPFAGGMIGKALLLGGEYEFDPLNLAVRSGKYLPWLRECELKHGRVAMLAFLGFVVPEFVRIPGPEACYAAPVMKAFEACGPVNIPAYNAATGTFASGPLYQVFLFIGLVEMVTSYPKFVQDHGQGFTFENAGDYKLGLKFLPKDPEQARQMKLKELNNGRLAMMAFAGIATQSAVTGNMSFPWMAHRQGLNRGPGLASGVALATSGLASRSSATQLRAYKMSKAVPFLPLSPAMDGVVGGEDEGFDPMGFSYAFDIRWLREAELKHGRVCMLATVGWISTDLGMRVSDSSAFQVSTIDAHLSMVKFGSMPQMLVWLGLAELFGFMAMIRMYQGKTDRAPGDFGLRALYPKDEAGQYQMQLKELRNGRLAMLAYGGIVTAAVLTGKPWPFFAVVESRATTAGDRSTFCGGLQKAQVRSSAVAAQAMERSASMPFLPKPEGLKGLVGEEVGFDPLAFAETFDARWLREAELKHGRVCMVAAVGFVAQQFLTFPGFTPTANANEAIYSANPAGWAALIFLAGFIESTSYGGKLTMLDMFEGKRDPGNFEFGSGFLKGKSDKEVYDMKLKELSNGRLAMMAIGGMIHHNFVVQGPLFPLIPEGWTAPAAWVTPDGEPIQSFMSGFVNGTSGLISNNTFGTA